MKYLRSTDFMPDSQEEAVIFIQGLRNWTRDRVCWDLHPITKSANVITVTGPLNKLVEDCLATSVRPARLAELTAARILNHVPIPVPTHTQWTGFDLDSLPRLESAIF